MKAPGRREHLVIDPALLRAEIYRRGMTLNAFSKHAGLSPDAIATILYRHAPDGAHVRVSTARKLAIAFELIQPIRGIDSLTCPCQQRQAEKPRHKEKRRGRSLLPPRRQGTNKMILARISTSTTRVTANASEPGFVRSDSGDTWSRWEPEPWKDESLADPAARKAVSE